MNYLELYRVFRRNHVSDDILAMAQMGVTFAAGVQGVDKLSFQEDRSENDSETSRQSSSSYHSSSRVLTSFSNREASSESDIDDEVTRADIIPKSLNLMLLLDFQNITYAVRNNHALPRCPECHLRTGSRRPASHFSGPEQNRSMTDESKEIKTLQNVSGQVKAGEILAVVGPSGSGKSTLIDALAERIVGNRLEGSVTLNGEDVKNKGIIRSISAYVLQDDLLFPMLTVKETFMFAAHLRLPRGYVEKSCRVDDILTQLNLRKVADTLIGDEKTRGISGGERRRVSIGKEIVHDPLLLFLDEPTSGLDSTNALLVVSTLQSIAKTGSIIMISVHQPSERILKLITTLLFIAEGQIIYRGAPSNIRDYFEIFLGYSIPEGTNAIEYALDLVQEFTINNDTGVLPLVHSFGRYSESNYPTVPTVDGSVQGEILRRRASQRADLESQLPAGVRGALAASMARGKMVNAAEYLNRYSYDCDNLVVHKFANSRIYEVYVLAWRGVLNIRRTPALFVTRFVAIMICSLLLGTVFWRLDYSPEGLRERLGFYAFATSTTYYICVDTLPIFLQERHIFTRETAHDSYRVSSYVLAIALINVPLLLFLAFAFSMITFWTVGLSGGVNAYIFFWMVISSALWAGNSFATLVSATISDVIAGYTILVAALAYFLLLSGFFITRTRIPKYWIWLHYLSLIKYPYEAVLLNEFDRSDSACYETGSQILSGTPFRGSAAVTDYLLSQLRPLLQSTEYHDLNGSTCMIDGAAVLRSQDVGELSKWACLAITISFGICYRLLFYVILRVSRKAQWRS